MKRIYLDNAATSFPKAAGLSKAVSYFIDEIGVNHSRTNSPKQEEVFDTLYSLRKDLCTLFNFPAPESVIFTKGVTEALNWLIYGLLKPEDHVLVSSAEHNSVMRPLVSRKIPFSRMPVDEYGYLLIDEIEPLITEKTTAIILNPAGNVSGAVQDLASIAEIAKKHNLLFIIDAAQAAPLMEIDMQKLGIDALAFTGHKGLLGPQGTGGMLLRKDLALKMQPLISGGTGTMSDSEQIPDTLPDRLSPGTENLPGLFGLAHSLKYVLGNKDELRKKTEENTRLLYGGLSEIEGIKIVGAPLNRPRTNVISITSDKTDIAQICAELGDFGIETRVGLHCSPSSHKALGTFPSGTLRFSPGPFTTQDEIEYTLKCIKKINC